MFDTVFMAQFLEGEIRVTPTKTQIYWKKFCRYKLKRSKYRSDGADSHDQQKN